MNTFPKIIEEQLTKVDPKIQEIFLSPTIFTRLNTIMGQEGLTVDQINSVFEEVFFVLTGLSSPEDFKEDLTHRLNLNPQHINNIVATTDSLIFQPVRKEILALYNQEPESQKTKTPLQKQNSVRQSTQSTHLTNRLSPQQILKEIESSPQTQTILNDRLNKKVVLTNETKKVETMPTNNPSQRRASDPYRELPE